MAELTPKERLQPSLLDRLSDDAPHETVESREQRVLSIEKLHDCVVRDLSWLLNAENFSSVYDLSNFPHASDSTINFGIPPISGRVISRVDRAELEEKIRESILRFEPRLLPQSVRVRASLDQDSMQPNSLSFEIEATVWAQPLPLQLLVTAQVDLESGDFKVESR